MNNLINVACLYTCNNNSVYMNYIPYVIENCLSLKIIPVILLINVDNLPKEYKKFEQYIKYIYFDKAINDVYISQVIRLFYPAVLKEYDVVMIGDIDLIMIKNVYYIENITQAFESDKFIAGRYKENQCFMSFNFCKPSIWERMFKTKTM